MDKDVFTVDEETAQPCSGRVPSLLEFLSGSGDVGDREMKPFHPARSNRCIQISDPQQLHLVLLNQRNDGSSSPPAHRVQIDGKVTLPVKASQDRPLLSGTKRDADAS